MVKFFIKTYAIIVFGLGSSMLSASELGKLDLDKASDARVAPAVIPVQCVFDFSPEKTKNSSLKMAAYLVSKGGVVTDDSLPVLYTMLI